MSSLINAYTKKVGEPWFTLMLLGIKTVEGRLNKGDFAGMNVGDIITFTNNDFNFERKFDVIITKINKYNSFYKYLFTEELDKCLPGITTIENGTNVYYTYFSEEEEEKYGVTAIHIEKI